MRFRTQSEPTTTKSRSQRRSDSQMQNSNLSKARRSEETMNNQSHLHNSQGAMNVQLAQPRSFRRKLSLPDIHFTRFRGSSIFGSDSSPSKSRQASANSSNTASSDGTPYTTASATPAEHDNQRSNTEARYGSHEKRRSSVASIISAVKDKIQRLVDSQRTTNPTENQEANLYKGQEEETIWSDEFTLDLPLSISRDVSELEYLRRTNMEAALGIISETESIKSFRSDDDNVEATVPPAVEPETTRVVDVVALRTSMEEITDSMDDTMPGEAENSDAQETPVEEVQENMESAEAMDARYHCIKRFRKSRRPKSEPSVDRTRVLCKQLSREIEAAEERRRLSEARRGYLPPF